MPTPAVSVVVPVYNPGTDIERCIESLLAQSMPADRLELIFVDDGSTDGTGERLDRLGADHSHVKVIHEPNSGWAGRPRNVGTDAATGDYVQYVDQDDELGRQALERLYEFGTTNESDIVIGKVVTDHFRVVPHDLWRRNVARCSIRTQPLITSLTPHKMFRTGFIRRNGIRFPEGKRRLEDQVFMTASYFATDAVAILADYPCYYYRRRDDGENSGAAAVDPAGYFQNMREVLDIVEANTTPGPFRDDLLEKFAQLVVRRVNRAALNRELPPGFFDTLVAEARGIVIERFPAAMIAELPALRRERLTAIADGDLALVRTLAERVAGIRGSVEVVDVRPIRKGWALQVVAGLRDPNGDPVAITSDSRDPIEGSVYVRERNRAIEWPVAETQVGLIGEVEIIPGRIAQGRPLSRGSWLLGARIRALGLTRTTRLNLTPVGLDPVPMRGGKLVATLEPGGVVRVRPAS